MIAKKDSRLFPRPDYRKKSDDGTVDMMGQLEVGQSMVVRRTEDLSSEQFGSKVSRLMNHYGLLWGKQFSRRVIRDTTELVGVEVVGDAFRIWRIR